MRFRLGLVLALLSSAALAQSGVAVKQSGNVTPNTIPWWVTSGVIGGGVTSADSPISSFGVTNNGPQGLCVNSDRITAAGRNTLCLGVKTAGGPAQLTVQSQGTAAPLGFQFVINGSTITPAGGITALTVGSTTIGSGTDKGLLYNNAGILGNLATANNGLLVTNGSGVPSISSTLPSGLTIPGYALLAGGNTFAGAQIFDITGNPINGFQVRTNDGGTTASSVAAINYAGTGSGATGGAFHGECIGGSLASPSQCKSGWMISGFGGIVHTGVGLSASSPSSTLYIADEDQTPTANGSHIDWYTTPIGTALVSRVNWMTLTNNGILQIKSTGTIKVGTGTADANSGAIIQGTVASGGVASLISRVDGAANFDGFHVNNSTSVAGLFAVVGEPSSATSVFGVANANYAEIVSSGSSNNGMLLGTLSASPIIFGTNSLEHARLTSGGFLNIGPAVAPDALLTVNANTGASIAPPSGTNLHLIGADGALNRIVMDTYGQVAVMAGYRADGTQASKTAVGAGDALFIFGANGWNTSAQVASSQISFTARETFSGTASGGSISIFTTPLTTTGVVEAARAQPSGGWAVGATAIATDKGVGTVALDGSLIFTVATKTVTLKQGANGTVGTFICTGGGTITITNSNVATSDGIGISMATAGGTITTPPAFKTITGATGFSVLCGATDTSTYNYFIIKNAA